MISKSWQLQEAKSRFSDLVNTAMTLGAQTVTKHGKPAVVVMSVEEYDRKFGKRKSLATALRTCPENLSELLGTRKKRGARNINLS
jgi:antitoxin Phd